MGSAGELTAFAKIRSKVMLRKVHELEGYTVGATDGELGKVEDLYFDDGRWVIRYMVVETGGWLSRRKVLISPRSVTSVAWDDGVMNVNLTRQQVTDSPSVDTDKPVSRQHEIDYYNYYGYPNYWEGANPWGLGMDPMPWVGASPDLASASRRPLDEALAREQQGRLDQERDSADSHLRSSKEVVGYEIMATDGPIGSVEAFVFDDESWAIRQMVVDTRKWLPGKHVLLSPAWIDHVSWAEHEVYLKVARQAVETSPEYDSSRPLSRDDEAVHYAKDDSKALS
ncbi:MAG: PRC-barrel domain-containing protein [Casimicrobiaceae bacterium]